MNIKEEMMMNSGIEEETLDEGLVIFKESKKLRKLSDKIANKLSKKKEKGDVDKDNIKMVEEIINRIREAADEFEELEQKFKDKEIEKDEAKKKHEKLSKKYSDLIDRLKRDRNKKIFAALGIAGTIGGALTGLHALGIGVSSVSKAASSFYLKSPKQ